jgi:CTP:molybdopterin cytidylyltransferase MocA
MSEGMSEGMGDGVSDGRSERGSAAPVAGLLLAAGAGRRMGAPKALLREPDGTPWVTRTARTLTDAGCAPVLAVLGAGADEVAGLLPPSVDAVRAEDWAEGMGASLRAGLSALAATPGPPGQPAPVAALVALVDTPGVGAEVVARLAALASPDALARAAYAGRPGHPVLIGRAHWDGVAEVARGDAGARDYLARHEATLVECGDIGDGRDVDRPADLATGPRLGG